jgi:hypothetical protein
MTVKTWIMAVVVIMGAVGAGPATRPAATKPAPKLIDLAPLEARVAAAESAADKAKADARARWEASDEYKRLAADVERKKKALDAARAGTDSKLKLDASAAYNAARAELADADARAMKGGGEKEATEALQRRMDLEEAKAENQRRLAAAHAVNPLERRTKLEMGMTVDEADQVMGGRLKRSGKIFSKSESVTAYEVELSNRHNFIDNARDSEAPGVYKLYLSFRDGKLAKMWRGPTDTSYQIND